MEDLERVDNPSADVPATEAPAERGESIERHPRDNVAGREKGKDLKSLLKNSFEEHRDKNGDEKCSFKDRQRNQGGRFEAEKPRGEDGGAQASPKPSTEIPEAEKTAGTVTQDAPQAQSSVAAPAALSKDVKAIWDTLPEQVKAEFVKREADTAKGVDQLKQRYAPIDQALAPYRPLLQQRGLTEGDAVKALFHWHNVLASNDPATKRNAFIQLAKNHNFDLSSLGSQPRAASQDPNYQPNQIDPNVLNQHLGPVVNRLQGLETELQRRDRERVESDLSGYAKDKPHYENVRVAMGHLISSGLAKGESPKEIFDDAYARACRADPEVFALIQQEETAKREAEAKAAEDARLKKLADDEAKRKAKEREEVDKARRAGAGPRGGSPTGRTLAGSPRGQSVRDTIRDVIQEKGAAI